MKDVFHDAIVDVSESDEVRGCDSEGMNNRQVRSSFDLDVILCVSYSLLAYCRMT
jgi:hypothetical protein